MKLEILVGMIASGKSTYARKRAEEGAVIIDTDAITLAVHGGVYQLFDGSLKPLYDRVKRAMFFEAAMAGRDVVVDSTGLTKERRRKWKSWGKVYGYQVDAVTFPVESPVIHADRRTEADSRGHDFHTWLRVTEQHYATFEDVSHDEGFDNIIHHRQGTL